MEKRDYFLKNVFINFSLVCVFLSLATILSAAESKGSESKVVALKWMSEADGLAKDGKFVRTSAPAVTFNYPTNIEILPLDQTHIFIGKDPSGLLSLNSGVFKIPPGKNETEFLREWAQGIARHFEAYYGGTDIKIVSNEPVDENKPYPAYQYKIEWVHGSGTWLFSAGRVISNDGLMFTVLGTTDCEMEVLNRIFQSIKMKP